MDTRSTIAVTVHDAPAEAAEPETTEEILETASADPALVETLRAGFGWQYPAADLAAVPAKVSVTSIVHKQEQTTLERPAFLSKDGLTAAEMGTALHAFLEHADFAALAAGLAGGGDTLAEAIRTERQRQVEAKLTPPEIAGKLDVSKIRRFVESEAFARIRAAKQVLRELDFITALPASAVLAAQGVPGRRQTPRPPRRGCWCRALRTSCWCLTTTSSCWTIRPTAKKTEQEFLDAYRAQLDLYALAIEKRFAPKPVTYKGIYSFSLNRLLEVET